jgi:hypothetical protein
MFIIMVGIALQEKDHLTVGEKKNYDLESQKKQ